MDATNQKRYGDNLSIFDLDIFDTRPAIVRIVDTKTPAYKPEPIDRINATCPICHGRGRDGFGRECRKCKGAN